MHTLLFQLLGQTCTIITGIFLARALGPAGKGLVGYAAVALSLATVFFDGQTEAIAYQIGRRGIPLRRVAFATIQLLKWILPFLVMVFLGIARFVPGQKMLIASAIALPFVLVAQLCVPYWLVLDRVNYANRQTLVTNVTYLVFIIPALLIFHAGVFLILALWILAQATGMCYGLLLSIGLLKTHKDLNPAPPHNPASQSETEAALSSMMASVDGAVGDAALLAHERSLELPLQPAPVSLSVEREQLGFTLKSGLAAVAGFLNLRVDVFIVSAMLGARELGVYTLAIATGELMWKVSAALIWSSLGRIATSPEPESARFVAKVTRHIFTMQMGIGIIAFFVGPLLIPIVYGEAYAQAGLALRALLPGLIAYTIEGAIGYYLTVQLGKPLLRLGIQVISIALCSVVSILTIPYFSIVGAALATSLSYLMVISIVCVMFIRHSKLPVRDLFVLSKPEIARIRDLFLSRLQVVRGRKIPFVEVSTKL